MIGIGNELRGDDAAGLEVARRLPRDRGFAVRAHPGEAVDLIEHWRGAKQVVLIDAVSSGAPPGTIHRIEATREPLPAALRRTSSHAIGAAEAIELARVLGRLPGQLVVYGIEGARFAAGSPLSDAVARAIPAAADAICRELS